MKKYFICSDIHSFYSLWMKSLTENGFDEENNDHIVVILGDLFDRGDEAIECLNFVRKMNSKDRLIYIKGNHEQLLLDCFAELQDYHRMIGFHHEHNRTIDTIAAFMGVNKYDVMCGVYNSSKLEDDVLPIINELRSMWKPFYEVNDNIFTHGWIPIQKVHYGQCQISEQWRLGDWERAAWTNGMEAWSLGGGLPGKTIWCGHWHTSYGWCNILNKGTEWDEDAIFEPFIQDGIVAMDGCVPVTKKVNCIVLNT